VAGAAWLRSGLRPAGSRGIWVLAAGGRRAVAHIPALALAVVCPGGRWWRLGGLQAQRDVSAGLHRCPGAGLGLGRPVDRGGGGELAVRSVDASESQARVTRTGLTVIAAGRRSCKACSAIAGTLPV